MTIGIGLLCNGGNRILLTADMRASYGEVTRNDQTGKLFDLPFSFAGAIAGTIGWCSEAISELHHLMGKIDPSEMGVEKLREAIHESYQRIYLLLAKEVLWNEFKLTFDQYIHDKKLARSIRNHAEEALKAIEVDVDMILAGFVRSGPVLLVAQGGTRVTIRPEISPGNAVIGTGSFAALNWLNYRKQNNSCGLAHSLLHLTEAKQFAQVEHSVGPLRQIILLWPGGLKALEGGKTFLQEIWNKYGLPQSIGLEREEYNRAVRETFGLEK